MGVLAVVVSFFLLITVLKLYGDAFYLTAAIFAFIGHIIVSFALIQAVPYTWDIGAFHQTTLTILSGELPIESSTVASFSGVQSILYSIFSSQPTTIGAFNGILAILLFIPIRYLCQQLYPRISDDHYGVMMLVLFLPLPFFLLSVPMRDTFTIFLFFSLIAIALRALLSRQPLLAIPLVPLWGMLFLLRPELALISLLGGIAATITEGLRGMGSDISAPKLGIALSPLGAIGFGLFAGLLYPFAAVNAELATRSRGGAVYLDGMQYTSWFDFLFALPGRAFYFQFAPFPLHVESAFHLLAFSATPIVIVLFVSAARSLYEGKCDETVAVLLVVVYLAGIAGYGAINSNFGTNVRHRIAFEFLLVIMAAPVIRRWELTVRKWIGVVPGHHSQSHEQERETEEFDRGMHIRDQNPNQTDNGNQAE
jgi:hypothetical protein